MDTMDADYSLGLIAFTMKYTRDFQEADEKEIGNAYEAYKVFYAKYHNDNPAATTDCYAEYLETLGKKGSSKITKPRDDVLDIAFTVPFSSNIDYITELNRQLESIRDSSEYFNYLAVVQSSGYGKTRAIHELAKLYPVIYLCFRSSASTGYPKATTHSFTLKNEIDFCDTMAKAEAVANRWLAAMIITFQEKSNVYNGMYGKKYHEYILEDRESKLQAKEFWDAVYRKKNQIDIPPTLTLNEFIIICFDEASVLAGTEDRKVFRAIRRALRNQRENIVGIFADTNSSIGDLVPTQDEDDSARDLNLHAHRPFIHIASTDCLSNTSYSEEEMKMGYNVVRYGRPLWQSMWKGMKYDAPSEKYRYLVDFAMTKLCGGTLNWTKHRQRSATALMACTVCIYICPLSRMARDLVKSHMATIITAEDSGKKHLIGYPSEPMLSEAALTLLSKPDVELDVLKELDLVGKEGGIIDTGNRGELCARILLLSARHRQILSFREENRENYPTFSAHRPVIGYLRELFSSEFPHQNFQHLAAYDVGFTHFIALDHTPDESTLQLCWDRGAAIIYQRNQPGADIALVMCHRNEKKLAVLNIQVKNHARPESKGVRNYAVANGLRTSITLCKTCAHLEESSVGIYIQIGEAYANNPKFETYCYGEGRNRRRNMTLNFSNDTREANRLVVLGLSCFKLDRKYHEVIRSLLRSWIDISTICRPTEFKFICRMFPVIYGSHATKRAKEINNDNDEDAKDYLINKRWKSDEQAEQDEEWSEEYE